jgi:cell shape-determining protein MreC
VPEYDAITATIRQQIATLNERVEAMGDQRFESIAELVHDLKQTESANNENDEASQAQLVQLEQLVAMLRELKTGNIVVDDE